MKGARFKIIGLSGLDDVPQLKINGKGVYRRLLIQRVKEEEIIEAKKTLMDYGKKFLIIGNSNAITYKEVFPYIKNNEIWLGVTLFCGKMPYFEVSLDTDVSRGASHYYKDGKLFKQINSIAWFTNLDHKKRHEELDLYKHYSPEEFPKYDNYDAIEVSKTCDIPLDYEGVMGVPITFLDKYCPSQFEIVGIMSGAKGDTFTNGNDGRAKFYVNDKGVYARVLIKRNTDKTKRDYLKTLMDYGKKFVILGNKNAITYKEIFPLIKDNQIWLGVTMQSGGRFIVEDEETTSKAAKCMNGVNTAFICGAHWFTNLDHKKRHEELDLYKHYSPEEFPHYDNYDAIEVSKTCDIPLDYEGVMGVPITFLDKYCPSQFEIVDLNPHFFSLVEQGFEKPKQLTLHNAGKKDPYARVLIKHV